MKLMTRFLLLSITILFFNCSSKSDSFLEINGKTVGTDTESILLVKAGQYFDSDSLIEIPVKDGTFHYRAKLEFPESVELFLGKAKNQGGRYMPLFLENDKINLTIYSEEEFDKNLVIGGKLNSEYKEYKESYDNTFNSRIQPLHDSMKKLFENDQYHSDKAKTLYAELRKAKNHDEKIIIYKKIDDLKEVNQHLSPKAERIENKLNPIYDEQKRFQQTYIENNPTIVSYSFFIKDLMYNKDNMDINLAKNNFQKLSKANPNHPYNKLAANLTEAIENIKVGKKYTDFTAPDLNGNKIKLSEKINGKIVLLDLWATWCGPCIAKSRTMIPIYEEFKDKGFTIIGVAGERKNTKRLVNFLEKEKWPWLNLVELDRQNNIWQKYNVDGGGGGIFLIDENGLIIAKDPTAEEVREELESRLI
ncbi:TlpA disulfide reductase family protein [Aestuariibaculum suncheonense]|uniref:AhpC/TSA family protein n=1 Tax=Aestuariibaculum suncheonense TaxID=1028745 RepID=A0A8J6UKP7_9FLAO|nr:TlpA disulfide reductase family protein [Aestuariibaculum suncheonense]MBD0835861.1 AhpC/TSA family protein [Aestuariibaculum suncheonense]